MGLLDLALLGNLTLLVIRWWDLVMPARLRTWVDEKLRDASHRLTECEWIAFVPWLGDRFALQGLVGCALGIWGICYLQDWFGLTVTDALLPVRSVDWSHNYIFSQLLSALSLQNSSLVQILPLGPYTFAVILRGSRNR